MGNQKIVAIHQPNFFPWLGFFHKLAHCDTFILLDHVQFPKTGGTWINRVRVLINGEHVWITLPIVRNYHGVRRIVDMEINDTTTWRNKLLKTIQTNYASTPWFKQIYPVIHELINCPFRSLRDYNVHVIRTVLDMLGINTSKLVLSSSLKPDGNATDLLVNLTKLVDGQVYLSGDGSEGYLEEEKFSKAGLELTYQRFQHPRYPQKGVNEFISGLSIIDVLMNCGIEETHHLIVNGKKEDKNVTTHY